MADTTPERLAELRRIAMAATQCVFEDAGNKIGIRSSDGVLYGIAEVDFDRDADREFFVAAANSVPALLDDIERLRARWAEQLRFTHEVTDASFAVACENAKLRGQLARAGAHDGGRPTA